MRSGAGAALRSPTDEAARSRCAPLAEQIGARAMVPAIGVAAKAVTTLAMSGPSAEPQPDSARIRPTLIRRVTSTSSTDPPPALRLPTGRSPSESAPCVLTSSTKLPCGSVTSAPAMSVPAVLRSSDRQLRSVAFERPCGVWSRERAAAHLRPTHLPRSQVSHARAAPLVVCARHPVT